MKEFPGNYVVKDVIVMRHGEYKTQGEDEEDAGLTREGKRQIKTLAEFLRDNIIVDKSPRYPGDEVYITNSQAPRAVESAEIIGHILPGCTRGDRWYELFWEYPHLPEGQIQDISKKVGAQFKRNVILVTHYDVAVNYVKHAMRQMGKKQGLRGLADLACGQAVVLDVRKQKASII